MSRAHRELSIHVEVADFHGLGVELRHLGMVASWQWLSAPPCHVGSVSWESIIGLPPQCMRSGLDHAIVADLGSIMAD